MSEELEADVVIVGTGAAGMTVAGEALRHGCSVLMIEAGGHSGPGRIGRHLRNDSPSDEQIDDFAVSMRDGLVFHGLVEEQHGDVALYPTVHAVGGRMTLWFNNCPEPAVDERSAAIAASQWPSLLNRARELMNVRRHLAPGSVREARLIDRMHGQLADLPLGRGVQPMPTAATSSAAGVRFAGADDLLLGDADVLPDTAMLLSESVARRIIIRGGHVQGVEVHPIGGGPPQIASGGTYVIAGGTIGTPQLLFASGVVNPALGAYMMDHPMFATRVELSPDILSGVAADDPSFSVWVPHSDNRPWHTQLSRTPYLEDLPGVPTRLTGDLISFTGSAPRLENQLLFDGDRLDGFGLPTHTSRFAPDANDWRIIDDMVRDHFELFRAIGVPGRGWTPLLGAWGTSLHLMGTSRIGARDDGTSVADADSRVWGYDNLFVGGNGVLSERNSCNPTLQTVAIALRSADRILGRSPSEIGDGESLSVAEGNKLATSGLS